MTVSEKSYGELGCKGCASNDIVTVQVDTLSNQATHPMMQHSKMIIIFLNIINLLYMTKSVIFIFSSVYHFQAKKSHLDHDFINCTDTGG